MKNKELTFKLLKIVAFGLVPFALDSLKVYVNKQAGMHIETKEEADG